MIKGIKFFDKERVPKNGKKLNINIMMITETRETTTTKVLYKRLRLHGLGINNTEKFLEFVKSTIVILVTLENLHLNT